LASKDFKRQANLMDDAIILHLSAGLEFRKMSSTAIPSFFAVVNAFFNLNFPRSLWQKTCVLCTTAIALSGLVKFEPWSGAAL
jgi:hypothetical protein